MSYVNGVLCCNNAFIKGVITVLDLIAIVILCSFQGSFLKLEFSLMTNRPVLILGWQPHHWWRYLWCSEWKLPYQTQNHAAPTEQGYSYIHCSTRKLWHFSKSPKQQLLVYSFYVSFIRLMYSFYSTWCQLESVSCDKMSELTITSATLLAGVIWLSCAVTLYVYGFPMTLQYAIFADLCGDLQYLTNM